MYSIIATIVLVILVYGSFRDNRIKRQLTRQIEYLKTQSQKAWDNTKSAEERVEKVRAVFKKEVHELHGETDKLRQMIWKHIEKQHSSR